MDASRRQLLKELCALPALSLPVTRRWVERLVEQPPTLPDTANFRVGGIYLDAAYTHPISIGARAACNEYLEHRATFDRRIGPGDNPRDAAVELFAKLIHAKPSDVAVVPSTMEAENLVGAAIGLGESAGVVTDELHYDASRIMYAELAKRGIPVREVAARNGAIELHDLEDAIGRYTRLVAISLVSNVSGFQHDLRKVCEIAHAKGALVYADIIQAAGANPIDVNASGVDFCGCGTYKWLMGDFGTAFLYVRPDRLSEIKRVQIGWRQIRQQKEDTYPLKEGETREAKWALGSDAAGIFEVSTPAWGSLACAAASLAYIHSVGVEAIARHRESLMERLRTELQKHGFKLLAPASLPGPVLVFAYEGAASRLKKPLHDAGIQISTYRNRIRISPSVYNTMEDVNKLIGALSERSA